MAERNGKIAAISKRARAARAARWCGLLALLERRPKRPGILVLNHHRVAYPDACPYDHGVIDSTPEQFERQIRWLQRHFRILTLEEVEEAVAGRRPIRDCGALITFDDGYIDNYAVAFPILKSLGVQGTFFPPHLLRGKFPRSVVGLDRVPGAPLAPRPHPTGVSARPGTGAGRRPGRGRHEAAAPVQIAGSGGAAALPGRAFRSLRRRRPGRRPASRFSSTGGKPRRCCAPAWRSARTPILTSCWPS